VGGGYFRLSLNGFFKYRLFYFRFPGRANAVFVLQASLVHFTLIQLRQKSEMRNKFVYFVKPAQLALRKSALQNVLFYSAVLYLKLYRPSVDPAGADISSHMVRCHLSKCGDVTECELILARAGIPGFSAAQAVGITICPRHKYLLGDSGEHQSRANIPVILVKLRLWWEDT